MSGQTSTKTGVAPSNETTSAEEKKVKSGTKTASPSPTPHALRARVRASVPLAQVRQCFTPTYSASWASSSLTWGPMIYLLLEATESMAASMSFFKTRYCLDKSRKFTLIIIRN